MTGRRPPAPRRPGAGEGSRAGGPLGVDPRHQILGVERLDVGHGAGGGGGSGRGQDPWATVSPVATSTTAAMAADDRCHPAAMPRMRCRWCVFVVPSRRRLRDPSWLVYLELRSSPSPTPSAARAKNLCSFGVQLSRARACASLDPDLVHRGGHPCFQLGAVGSRRPDRHPQPGRQGRTVAGEFVGPGRGCLRPGAPPVGSRGHPDGVRRRADQPDPHHGQRRTIPSANRAGSRSPRTS